MHVLMIEDQIQIDANSVDTYYAHIFKSILKLWLINHFLKRMQVEVEYLVFLDHKTPKIQNLIHGILLKAG